MNKSIWQNTALTTGDYVNEINSLKKAKGKDIIVYGGVIFVSSFIEAQLKFNIYTNFYTYLSTLISI